MSKLYLTCDIGGTDLKFGITDENYNLIYTNSTPTKAKEGGLAIMDQIVNIYNELKDDYKIEGIAISSAGVINPNTTQVLDATNAITDYIGVNVAAEINKHIVIPVAIENDVNCVALCEATLGAGKDYKNVVAVTVGTGIGGAIVKNGQLDHGNGFSAGEWGNTIIDYKNLTRYENLASTRALVNFAKEVNPEIKNGIDVFKLFDNNDSTIVPIVNNFYNNLAIGLVNIIYSLSPEVVVLGGGITARGQKFLNELKSFIEPKISPYVLSKTKIVIANYKNDAGMIGALINYKNRH